MNTVIAFAICSSALIFSAAFKQCVIIDSSSSSISFTFLPKDLETQHFFLFYSSTCRSIQGTPLNSIAVFDPKTFVPFFTQVFEAIFKS